MTKSLEALYRIAEHMPEENGYCYEEGDRDCRIIEKELKAFEIIKRREIDVKDITETTNNYNLYVAYCQGKGYAKEYICDKDEFNLLRKVLENEA